MDAGDVIISMGSKSITYFTPQHLRSEEFFSGNWQLEYRKCDMSAAEGRTVKVHPTDHATADRSMAMLAGNNRYTLVGTQDGKLARICRSGVDIVLWPSFR